MAKFQHVVRKVLEGGGRRVLAGQMLVIIIRLLYDFQYICEVFVLFSRIYSSRVVSFYVNLIIYGLFCSGSCSLYKRYVNLLKIWSFMKLNIVF